MLIPIFLECSNMKFRDPLIIFFVFMMVFLSCNTKTPLQPLDVETEVIDFSTIKRIETNSFPESIIKNVSYVKLDGSFEDSQFKQIFVLKIANNRIFILDVLLRKLVVFDSTGKGLGTVGNRGQGPREYQRIHDFCVSDAGDIYLMDGTKGNCRLFVFDKDLKFVSEDRLP